MEPPGDPELLVWVLEATRPAIVLGSAQPAHIVDGAAAAAGGFSIARRRSGGGAVLVVPGDIVWIDVVVPVGDDRWVDDVGLASHWLGDVWAGVIESLGYPAAVHRGGLDADGLARLVCFGAVGPGEVALKGAGLGEGKVVGISQRRTRDYARFQTACILRWDPTPFEALLGPFTPEQMGRLHQAGHGVAAGANDVVALFLEAISAT